MDTKEHAYHQHKNLENTYGKTGFGMAEKYRIGYPLKLDEKVKKKTNEQTNDNQYTISLLKKAYESVKQRNKSHSDINTLKLVKKIVRLTKETFGSNSTQFNNALHDLVLVLNSSAINLLNDGNLPHAMKLLESAKSIFSCYYRRIKKLKIALRFLTRAEAISNMYISEVSAGNRKSLIYGEMIQSNLCAVLSELSRHSQALEHASNAVKISKETVKKLWRECTTNKIDESLKITEDCIDTLPIEKISQTLCDGFSNIAIAKYNLGAQQEFCKRDPSETYEGAMMWQKLAIRCENRLVPNGDAADNSDSKHLFENFAAAFNQSINRKSRAKTGAISIRNQNVADLRKIRSKALIKKGVHGKVNYRKFTKITDRLKEADRRSRGPPKYRNIVISPVKSSKADAIATGTAKVDSRYEYSYKKKILKNDTKQGTKQIKREVRYERKQPLQNKKIDDSKIRQKRTVPILTLNDAVSTVKAVEKFKKPLKVRARILNWLSGFLKRHRTKRHMPPEYHTSANFKSKKKKARQNGLFIKSSKVFSKSHLEKKKDTFKIKDSSKCNPNIRKWLRKIGFQSLIPVFASQQVTIAEVNKLKEMIILAEKSKTELDLNQFYRILKERFGIEKKHNRGRFCNSLKEFNQNSFSVYKERAVWRPNNTHQPSGGFSKLVALPSPLPTVRRDVTKKNHDQRGQLRGKLLIRKKKENSRLRRSETSLKKSQHTKASTYRRKGYKTSRKKDQRRRYLKEKGHDKVAEKLIIAGAEVDLADEEGHTPLSIASQNGLPSDNMLSSNSDKKNIGVEYFKDVDSCGKDLFSKKDKKRPEIESSNQVELFVPKVKNESNGQLTSRHLSKVLCAPLFDIVYDDGYSEDGVPLGLIRQHQESLSAGLTNGTIIEANRYGQGTWFSGRIQRVSVVNNDCTIGEGSDVLPQNNSLYVASNNLFPKGKMFNLRGDYKKEGDTSNHNIKSKSRLHDQLMFIKELNLAASKIQNNFRIQRAFRRRKILSCQICAAKCIQSNWRMRFLKVDVNLSNLSAVGKQIKSTKEQKDEQLQNVHQYALKLQRTFRGHRLRIALQNILRKEKAATMIQMAYISYFQRKGKRLLQHSGTVNALDIPLNSETVDFIRDSGLIERSAVKIQRAVRFFFSSNVLSDEIKPTSELQQSLSDSHHLLELGSSAAVNISDDNLRSKAQRDICSVIYKYILSRRHEKNRNLRYRRKAASTLQLHIRLFLDRVKVENNAAKILVAAARKHFSTRRKAEKANISMINNAATIIQKNIRGILLRRKLEHEFETALSYDKAATKIQASLRGFLFRRAERQESLYLQAIEWDLAAVSIQSLYREYLIRRKSSQ